MVSKFTFDVSKAIVDANGSIYIYKGDGFIASWDFGGAGGMDFDILEVVDEMFSAVASQADDYLRDFGVAPSFRVGIHGGSVVLSEVGDNRRAIGMYGDAINIAARMEDAAKLHNMRCVLSGEIVAKLRLSSGRLKSLGVEYVRGIASPIGIYAYAAGKDADCLQGCDARSSVDVEQDL